MMEHIKLIDRSSEINNQVLRKIYLSKLEYLVSKLMYLDVKGIEGTVIFYARDQDGRLETSVEVTSEDDGYRKVIEGVTDGFTTN